MSKAETNGNGVMQMDTSEAPAPALVEPAAVQMVPIMAVASVAMPLLQQSDKVFVGPGARKEADVIGLGLTQLSSRQKEDLERARRYAMEQSIQYVIRRQQQQHQQNQQKVAMYAQALSLMSRVYVGSISFDIREDTIKTVFAVFGPIKSVNMSWDGVTGHHKGFAFVEFEIPEAAVLAQDAMNGKQMGGRNLRVAPAGKPANMPQAQPIIDMIMQEAKSYHRIYVSSVHPDLTEQDLRSVFEAFGKIQRCQLAKSGPGKAHRGFGYLEFDSAQAVKEAIDGMNNFDLGGQYLQVGRCVTPPEALSYLGFTPATVSAFPSASAQACALVTAQIQAQEIAGMGKSSSSAGSSSPPSSSNVNKEAELASKSPMPCVPGSPPTEASPPAPSSPGQDGRRAPRRGFGGFAGAAAVPPPMMIQSLPPPQLVGSLPAPVGLAPQPSVDQSKQPTLLPIPKPAERESPAKKDILERIKIKTPSNLHLTERATFAPLPSQYAPRDRDAEGEEDMDIDDNGMLAIGGADGVGSSSALALRDSSSRAVAKVKNDVKADAGDAQGHKHFRKKKVKPAKVRIPNLSTPQAQAAAQKVGVLNDIIQAANAANEEASIASQENFEIRGNEHRNALMHKLKAKLDRSSIIMLTNMVTADQVDDELEDEIRDECGKFGTVVDGGVVIVVDRATNEVKIFVRFAEPTQAESARVALDKRFFAGRSIGAAFYDQTLFEHEDYTA